MSLTCPDPPNLWVRLGGGLGGLKNYSGLRMATQSAIFNGSNGSTK